MDNPAGTVKFEWRSQALEVSHHGPKKVEYTGFVSHPAIADISMHLQYRTPVHESGYEGGDAIVFVACCADASLIPQSTSKQPDLSNFEQAEADRCP